MDLLDPEDLLECRVHLDLKVSKDPWENPVILVPLDHRERPDLEDCLVYLERMVNPDVMEKEGLWDPLDLPVKEVCQECRLCPGPKDTVVSPVWMEQREKSVALVKREKKDHLDPRDLLGQWDLQDPEGKEAVKVLPVPWD